MEKQHVIEFFDRQAAHWDADMIRHDDVIARILDLGNVREGATVLDVACGTGVLVPDYLERKVASVTGVDISQEMIRVAESKFHQENVRFLCRDVEECEDLGKFDCVMVYNAFPHFPEPEDLIRKLSGMLKPGGTLTVAHGMSRAQIDHRHQGGASKVSVGLMHEDALEAIFSKYLTVTVKISDERMYQVSGVLK